MATQDPQQPLKRLKGLQAKEVSIVDRGANRRPFLVIKDEKGAKDAPPPAAAAVPMLTAEQERRFDAVLKRRMAVRKDDAGAQSDADDGGTAEDEGLDERGTAALKAVYRILLPFKGQITEDMVDDVLAELDLDGTDDEDTDDGDDQNVVVDEQQPEETAMAKASQPAELAKAADWSPSKPDGVSDDDHQKALDAAKAAYDSAVSKADDDEEDDDDDDDEDTVSKKAVAKSAHLPAAQAELVQKAEAKAKAWIEKAAELEARLAKMEGERILKSHEDDVRQDCAVLGKDATEQARIIKKAYEAGKESGDAYRALLRDAARISRESGVFKSVGTSNNAQYGGGEVPSEQGSAEQQLNAMLRGAVQKGEATDEVAAWKQVLNTKRGQELYDLSRKGL